MVEGRTAPTGERGYTGNPLNTYANNGTKVAGGITNALSQAGKLGTTPELVDNKGGPLSLQILRGLYGEDTVSLSAAYYRVVGRKEDGSAAGK